MKHRSVKSVPPNALAARNTKGQLDTHCSILKVFTGREEQIEMALTSGGVVEKYSVRYPSPPPDKTTLQSH